MCWGHPQPGAGPGRRPPPRFSCSTSYGRYMTVLDEAAPSGEPTDARGRVAELHAIRAAALRGPSEKATEAQHAKGKLTARERIELRL
ncbi:methylmalonyl-CoA carboxyltransferase, partial [Streptomyces sp. NPDC127044]